MQKEPNADRFGGDQIHWANPRQPGHVEAKINKPNLIPMNHDIQTYINNGKEEPASPSSPALLGCAMADLAGGSSVIWTRHLTCPATVALPVLARDEGRRRGEGGGAPPAVCTRGRRRRRRGRGWRGPAGREKEPAAVWGAARVSGLRLSPLPPRNAWNCSLVAALGFWARAGVDVSLRGASRRGGEEAGGGGEERRRGER